MKLALGVMGLVAVSATAVVAAQAFSTQGQGSVLVIDEIKDDVGMVISKHVDYIRQDSQLSFSEREARIDALEMFWVTYMNDGLGGLVKKRDYRKELFPLLEDYDNYVMQDTSLLPPQREAYLMRSANLRSLAGG